MKIPFVDLHAQYLSIKAELDEAIAAVIQESAFIGGRYLDAFEHAFARYCGTLFAVGVSNGTDALRLALLACNVGPGDDVITVPNTFIATTEAISMVGANVRFVDVRPGAFTLDPESLERAITEKTRAVIPVHLYGRPAEMDPILEIARRRGLRVVADAAQAHGARYHGREIGTLGDVVCFSFYPGKNLGAYGDAGAIVTNDPDIRRTVAMLRDHGRAEKYEHEIEGFNCRLDGLQAAILNAKLPYMEEWTEKRRRHARHYSDCLAGIPGIAVPREDLDVRSVYHLYVIQVEKRDKVRAFLQDRGISTGVHYPIPLHLQPAYARLQLPAGSFAVAETQAQTVLSLPMYAELSDEQVEFVVAAVREAVSAL
jgi:dTDP-4-amino-4,6-dideoxygalactose transaminase